MIVQLKPRSEAFSAFIFRGLKRLDAIVLCEGKTEVEVYKAVLRRLDIELPGALGVTDCEGLAAVPRIAAATALLAALARKLKTIAVIVDAERWTYRKRFESFLDSLRSVGALEVAHEVRTHHAQVYEATITSPRQLKLLVAINGDLGLPYQTHSIEDHLVRLAILEGLIAPHQVSGVLTAKQLLEVAAIRSLEMLKDAKPENVERALEHLVLITKLLL